MQTVRGDNWGGTPLEDTELSRKVKEKTFIHKIGHTKTTVKDFDGNNECQTKKEENKL